MYWNTEKWHFIFTGITAIRNGKQHHKHIVANFRDIEWSTKRGTKSVKSNKEWSI
jgi:hypothetical protein